MTGYSSLIVKEGLPFLTANYSIRGYKRVSQDRSGELPTSQLLESQRNSTYPIEIAPRSHATVKLAVQEQE